MSSVHPSDANDHFKDSVLARLAETANVAQFASFGPTSCELRHLCVSNPPRRIPRDVEAVVELMLARAADASVNVRSFDPSQPKSHEFVYGIRSASAAAAHVRRLGGSGLFTIANETVDVSDGGVSGVALGGLIEFAPDDTPRCVDKPGTVSLPVDVGLRVLKTVYGFEPELPREPDVRTEFSIHPLRRGIRHSHTLLWEQERSSVARLEAPVRWPNHFSRFIGDKVFGLLVAESLGLPVPRTVVTHRRVAPFEFGEHTGTGEVWLRTAPAEPQPGRFTTTLGWRDPYALLAQEDPQGNEIPAVLAQEAVDARYSGAAAHTEGGAEMVEGVCGAGDDFMVGRRAPEPLPAHVALHVREVLRVLQRHMGAVRIEWVHDDQRLWIVQLHLGAVSATASGVIYPGRAAIEHEFFVEQGLDALRVLTSRLAGTGEGVVVRGSVGVTSHFGDVLRKARIPARLESRAR